MEWINNRVRMAATPPITTNRAALSEGRPMDRFTQYTQETAPQGSKEGLAAANKAFGFVPNLQSFMAESPALLNSYGAVWDIYSRQASLDPVERQVVLLTANYENRCHYCMAGHTALARIAKMDKATSRRGFVSDADVEAFLAAGYTRANVFDVIAGVALKVMSNYTNHITH